MKLLLVRHGQSEDDVIDAYGGWADFPLTELGKEQLAQTAENIANLDIEFEKLLVSPLIRAQESAKFISERVNLPIETFEYVKERNSYGILCGMVKSVAKEKYPWLVESYEKGEYVDGSEREEDIKTRAQKALELIRKMPYQNIIVVTHGVFLKAFLPLAINKELLKKEDAGFILVELSQSGGEVITQKGIEVK